MIGLPWACGELGAAAHPAVKDEDFERFELILTMNWDRLGSSLRG